MSPQAAILPGDRLHLAHGPIDVLIGAEGDRRAAFHAARRRFGTVLQELVAELDLLRRPVSARPSGTIARRMFGAAAPFADGVTTPMICVAGAVAETVLAAMVDAADLSRAYVNNGGDIALHLTGDARFRIAIASVDGDGLGHLDLTAADRIRGIATSGRHGRSLSRGIADSVTVVARRAAGADAAATAIANAVDLPGHPAISRQPARAVRDDSDLRETPVVRSVGALSDADADRALRAGRAVAETLRPPGLIDGAALFLRGRSTATGRIDPPDTITRKAQPCPMS